MRKDAEGSPLAGEHGPLTGDLPTKTVTGIRTTTTTMEMTTTVDGDDDDGCTALHAASADAQVGTAQKLLDAGADMDARQEAAGEKGGDYSFDITTLPRPTPATASAVVAAEHDLARTKWLAGLCAGACTDAGQAADAAHKVVHAAQDAARAAKAKTIEAVDAAVAAASGAAAAARSSLGAALRELKVPVFAGGEVVMVVGCTRSGFNRPGGQARIVRANDEGASSALLKDGSAGGVRTTRYTYNVKMVLDSSTQTLDVQWIEVLPPDNTDPDAPLPGRRARRGGGLGRG